MFHNITAPGRVRIHSFMPGLSPFLMSENGIIVGLELSNQRLMSDGDWTRLISFIITATAAKAAGNTSNRQPNPETSCSYCYLSMHRHEGDSSLVEG